MPLECGENTFTGTANGLGVSFNKAQAENNAKLDAERNARDTVTAILLRKGDCPGECSDRRVFDNTPVNTQLLVGAAKPKLKFHIIWFAFIPIIIPYWQAQASSDWDLKIFCLKQAKVQP